MSRLFAYAFMVSWLIQIPALYPLPSDRVASFENPSIAGTKDDASRATKAAPPLDVKPALARELWQSWIFNLVLVVVGLSAAVLMLKRSAIWPVALVVSSLLFVSVWWWFSGIGEQTVADWVRNRWLVWPKLALQLQGFAPFAKIILNDYIFFTFYHASIVIGLVALVKTSRRTESMPIT